MSWKISRGRGVFLIFSSSMNCKYMKINQTIKHYSGPWPYRGEMTRRTPLGGRVIALGSRLDRKLERKPKMLVAIAPANKMARQIRALLT